MKREPVSATARLIAAATVMLDANPRTRGLPPAGAAEWSARFLGAGSRLDRLALRAARTAPGRIAGAMFQRVTIPGLFEHFQRRKRTIEGWCRAALAEGFSQAVVLGAGLDTLAVRASREGGVAQWFEADRPPTLALKRRVYEGVERPPLLLELSLGRGGTVESLRRGGVDLSLPTLVVAEGLLMYLSPAEIAELFAELVAIPWARARIVFSFMEGADGSAARFRPQSPLVAPWLRWRREPFRSALDPARLEGTLAAWGWRLKQVVRFEHPAGEAVALADRAG